MAQPTRAPALCRSRPAREQLHLAHRRKVRSSATTTRRRDNHSCDGPPAKLALPLCSRRSRTPLHARHGHAVSRGSRRRHTWQLRIAGRSCHPPRHRPKSSQDPTAAAAGMPRPARPLVQLPPIQWTSAVARTPQRVIAKHTHLARSVRPPLPPSPVCRAAPSPSFRSARRPLPPSPVCRAAPAPTFRSIGRPSRSLRNSCFIYKILSNGNPSRSSTGCRKVRTRSPR
jgi:hypothetical protein